MKRKRKEKLHFKKKKVAALSHQPHKEKPAGTHLAARWQSVMVAYVCLLYFAAFSLKFESQAILRCQSGSVHCQKSSVLNFAFKARAFRSF